MLAYRSVLKRVFPVIHKIDVDEAAGVAIIQMPLIEAVRRAVIGIHIDAVHLQLHGRRRCP
ncbi:hypothetical protein [Paenibacillus andongensis]|uniref:hypothetical protein n=1 Tax=Paenibacillus andongensis TaxID=2975482 RepID=UPI0021BB31B0|nr:hypothetical protein [Paenibacillus andongensis]